VCVVKTPLSIQALPLYNVLSLTSTYDECACVCVCMRVRVRMCVISCVWCVCATQTQNRRVMMYAACVVCAVCKCTAEQTFAHMHTCAERNAYECVYVCVCECVCVYVCVYVCAQ